MILTGREVGERDEAGAYPENTINDLVDKKLRSIAQSLKAFGETGEKKKGPETGGAENA